LELIVLELNHYRCGNGKAADPRFVSTITLSTLSQLKHSNVRTSKANRAVLTRVSTIGARHLMQGWLSILVDAKQVLVPTTANPGSGSGKRSAANENTRKPRGDE
jgi:hypothetical protein